jgi:peptidoglycan-associated lipoprotein
MREEITMKKAIRVGYVLVMIGAVLFLLGCAKKTLEPGTPEITKPQPPTQAGEPSGQPSMKMEPSGAGEGAGGPSGKTDLDRARAAFENTDIFFEYDSFDLTADAKKILAEKAGFLSSHPRIKIRIEGNCDERGTEEYNLALGERRAKAAQDYLVFLGVSPERIATVSYGEEKPADPRHDEAAWVKNRRDHFAILGE